MFAKISFADTKVNCAGLAKLKSECNFVGKGMNKMKEFSSKNKTIDQVGKNLGKGINKIKDKF